MVANNTPTRSLIAELRPEVSSPVTLRGWIIRLRNLAKNTFIVLRDCSGEIQCVVDSARFRGIHLKAEDTVEVTGSVQVDTRASGGFELVVDGLCVLNSSSHQLPFHSVSDTAAISSEVILEYRPLSLRTDTYSDIFKIQAAILHSFREYLKSNYFTEIITSKIVGGGTEGGTNLFEIKYFERSAYLAQSPQFYKEQCVAGFERVFETGHVYRAEPHASSRHLTEYYSLDLEIGFIDGPEDVIELERNLLSHIFEHLNAAYGPTILKHRGALLPSICNTVTWEFGECLERLYSRYGRTDLVDDLDPEAERQLCAIALEETGINAVFVLGFPLANRPFYTHPRCSNGSAQSFDLLFDGLEVTTGGQRLHKRVDLESAIRSRGIDPISFESHLKMFELGMPPHGGLAIGLERLTAQILNRHNVREATLYPRDRYRLFP